jgi:hypothetical protein
MKTAVKKTVVKKAAPKSKMKMGGTKNKMQAGGATKMTKTAEQCDPGDGTCKQVRKGNIFQRWGDKMRKNKSRNFKKKKLVR